MANGNLRRGGRLGTTFVDWRGSVGGLADGWWKRDAGGAEGERGLRTWGGANHILAASGRQRRAAVLIFRRQFLTQPRHGAIEVMKIEPVDAGDPIILAPAVRRAIGAADEQPVQHGVSAGAIIPQ